MCGIANPAVQKCLLSEPELTLTKAVTITQALELAEKGSKDLQSSTVKDLPKDIHKFSHIPNSKNSSQTRKDVVASDRTPTGTCYCCGGKHNQSTCRFKSEVCHFCKKRGHIAKVCRSKLAQNKAPVAVDSSKPTHQVTQDSGDIVSSEYTLSTLLSQQAKSLQVDVEIEGHRLNMEIETGAAFSIRPVPVYLTFKHFHSSQPKSSFELILERAHRY